MKDYVMCPLCKKKFNMIHHSHLKNEHNMTVADFKLVFPDYPMMSESYALKRKELGSKYLTEYNKSDKGRKKSSQNCKILNQDSERQFKKMQMNTRPR